MNNRSLLASSVRALIVFSILFQTTQGQNTKPSRPADDARVARLIGLAKVWGTVKYFHPFLAYRDIDWDKALVLAIPKVNAATTPQEYQAALRQMLAVLDDRSTRVDVETAPKAAETTPPNNTAANPVRVEGRVLVIDAAQIAKTLAQDGSQFGRFIGDINKALATADGVVIDARLANKPEESESDFFAVLVRQVLPTMLDTPIILSSSRYRMHSGYATQIGRGSDLYSSAFVTSIPQTIEARAKTKKPIAFIVNENAFSFTDVLGGLQAANRALVIQEGKQEIESGGGTFTLELPDNLKVRMRTAEQINPDGSTGFKADIVVPKSASDDAAMKEALRAAQQNGNEQKPTRTPQTLTMPISHKDKVYAEMEFPSVEYRLLALFRFWNVINYFYPYRNLIGQSWESVLPRFIPKFEANKDAVEYQLTVRELVSEIHDSHGGVRNANASLEKLGNFLPPVVTSYVENRSVVTRVLDEKLPIKVGDVVIAVDNEPVEHRLEFLSRFLPASTTQWLMLGVHSILLAGPKDSVAKVRVRGPGGEMRDVELARSISIMDPKLFAVFERTTPMIQVLPSGYGYVDLARLQVGDVDKMFAMIKNTPATIFDMRGYPNGTAWEIAPRLTEKKNVVAALFSRPLLEATSLDNTYFADGASYSFAQRLPEAKGDVYKGKVVMLINEEAISQAEHTCMFFEAATDVTFIGTPTAGANGDVTVMVLPGNLPVSFTGHNVRHADGRQLQRLGIQPTIRVAPTIKGIIEGRDEILEGAIKYLQTSLKK